VATFLDFKEQNHTFDDIIGLAYLSVRCASRQGTEQVQCGWVTPDTVTVLEQQTLAAAVRDVRRRKTRFSAGVRRESSIMGQAVQQGSEGARNDAESQRHAEVVDCDNAAAISFR
jgi:hypothetical protein